MRNNIITNTAQRLLVIVLLANIEMSSKSQSIIDWITDPGGSAASYIESKIKEEASNIWEGILDANIQSDLNEKSQRIASFEFDDTTYVQKVFDYYPKWAKKKNSLESIRTRLTLLPTNYLYYYYIGGAICNLGDGLVLEQLTSQADSVMKENRICQLLEILKGAAADSARILSLDKDGEFLNRLLADPALVLTFNSTPSLIRLNSTWTGLPIADNAKQLLYWGKLAHKEEKLLPKKMISYNPYKLSFAANNHSDIAISYDGIDVGTMNEAGNIIPQSMELMNLHPMPKTSYIVEENLYTTDFLGRVIQVKQHSIDKKKSNMKKGKLKAKHVMSVQAASAQTRPFFIIPIKQGGTESRLNIVPLMDTKNNKQQLKAFEKKKKELLKDKKPVMIRYELIYSSKTDSQTPECILIHLNDNCFKLSNKAV